MTSEDQEVYDDLKIYELTIRSYEQVSFSSGNQHHSNEINSCDKLFCVHENHQGVNTVNNIEEEKYASIPLSYSKSL